MYPSRSRCRTPHCWGALLWQSLQWTCDCDGLCVVWVLICVFWLFFVLIESVLLWFWVVMIYGFVVYGFFMGLWWMVVASGGFCDFFFLNLWWDFVGLWWLVVGFCWLGGGQWRRWLSFVWFVVAGEYCWIFGGSIFVFLRCAKHCKVFGKNLFSLKSFAFENSCKVFYNETNRA